MSRHSLLIRASLWLATSAAGLRAADEPRLVTSWKERDATVVAFSPDGRALISSGTEGDRLRDAKTGAVRAVLSPPPLSGYGKRVFSGDGHLLFAQVRTDRELPLIAHDLKVWDVATGEPRGTFPYVGEHLAEGSFELSADGRFLAFVDNSERLPAQLSTSTMRFERGQSAEITLNTNPALPRIRIWDVAAWKELAVVDGGLPLAFSPDGHVLATGDRDWKAPVARLWDTVTGRSLGELMNRSPGLWPLAFSPDGRFLASCEHGPKSLWSLNDGRRWAVESEGTGLTSRVPAFSPNGELLFPNGLPHMSPQIGQREEYPCFDLNTMPPTRIDLGPGRIIISPSGRHFAAGLGEDGSGNPVALALRDLPSLRETARLEVSGLMGARFSPDGRWLAVLAGRREEAPPPEGTRFVLEIRLLEPATGRPALTVPSPGPSWGNYDWHFSPDGNSLAVYYRTGSNSSRQGEPDPTDRPMNVEIWEIPR